MECLWLLGLKRERQEVEGEPKGENEHARLCRQLVAQEKVDRGDMLARLEYSQLAECGVISDLTQFQLRRRRINNINFYLQKKYNLVREDNQAFARLLLEALNPANFSAESLPLTKDNLLAYLGYFDTDPNRVLDLLLVALAMNATLPAHRLQGYLSLIESFKTNSISHLLGHKLAVLHQAIQDQEALLDIHLHLNVTRLTLQHLQNQIIQAVALLLSQGLLQISEIWPHLSPSQEHLAQEVARLKKKAQDYFLRNFRLRLNQNQEQKEAEEAQEEKDIVAQLDHTQKYSLLVSLAKANQWSVLIDLLQQHPVSLPHCQSLLNLLLVRFSTLLDPLYHYHHPQISPHQNTSLTPDEHREALKQVIVYLHILKFQVGSCPVVYVKLCRVVLCLYQDSSLAAPESMDRLVEEYLVPGLTLQRCNMNMVASLWNLLKERDYPCRYAIYEQMARRQLYQCPQQMLRINETYKEIKNWLGKIAKDNIKIQSKHLGRISLNNPWLVANELLKRVKNYTANQIQIVVASMAVTSPLFQDVVVFSALRVLNEGAADQDWRTYLQQFLGVFFKRFYRSDLGGVFVFLANKVSRDDLAHLGMLNEVLNKMTGVEYIDNLTYDQLLAQAGGYDLQVESLSYSQEVRQAKKSLIALKNFFWKRSLHSAPQQRSLFFTLVAVLCQQKQKALFLSCGSSNAALKQLSVSYDSLCASIGQLLWFGRHHSESYAHYQALLPAQALETLVQSCRVSFAQSMHIIRKSLKPIHLMSDSERNALMEQMVNLFDGLDPQEAFRQDIRSEQPNLVPEYLQGQLRKDTWDTMAKELYFHFWVFTLDNIFTPSAQYEHQIQKLEKRAATLEDEKLLAGNDVQQTSSSQQKQKAKQEKEIEFHQNITKKLRAEWQAQEKKRQNIEQYLLSHKDTIFEGPVLLSDHFVQHCLLPRIQLEQGEAIYAAQFVHLFHRHKKPSFLQLLANLVNLALLLLPTLHCCTFREAQNLGAFLGELWQPLAYFQDETRLKADLTPFLKANTPFDFKKDQKSLAALFAKVCLSLETYNSEHYLQKRNALGFLGTLDQILPLFPATKKNATQLKVYLDKLRKASDMEDLTLLIKSYRTNLKNKVGALPEVDAAELDLARLLGDKPTVPSTLQAQLQQQRVMVQQQYNGKKDKPKKEKEGKRKNQRLSYEEGEGESSGSHKRVKEDKGKNEISDYALKIKNNLIQEMKEKEQKTEEGQKSKEYKGERKEEGGIYKEYLQKDKYKQERKKESSNEREKHPRGNEYRKKEYPKY